MVNPSLEAGVYILYEMLIVGYQETCIFHLLQSEKLTVSEIGIWGIILI